jgi:hypothetical protein
MKNLALRLTLLGLFVVATGVAAYVSWMDNGRTRQDALALSAFDAAAVGAQRDLLELRAAQQGYVAAGQGDQFWAAKVDAAVARLHDILNRLRADSRSAEAQTALDNAASALQDYEQMDRRARDYAHSGQKLLASDLIFANGFDLTGAAAAAVEGARLAERQAREASADALSRRGLAAAGGAAAVGLLVIALLIPRGAAPAPLADRPERTTSRAEGAPAHSPQAADRVDEGWSAARVVPAKKTAPRPAATPVSATGRTSPAGSVVAASAAAPAVAAPPALDLPGVASLCSDLARVVDTHALPGILERAAAVLDAPGIVLWIADPDGRELSPVVTHGYPTQLVSRLGTIMRDAENATASAFRTSLLQTVKTDAVSNGAIAAPLVTPGGCVGVMAAEVRNHGEKDAARIAVATIVAAQLATLVGPPSARAHARVEAAGA